MRGLSGATEVLEELYRDARQQLVLAAYALTGDVGEAQEAVQEAFVRALARPGKVLRADNPVAWMRTVTLNIVRGKHRRQRRFGVLVRKIPVPGPVPGLSPDRVALISAIWRLPVSQREAIALYYFADLPVEDVATVLGAPASTVKTWLRRGRLALAGEFTADSGNLTSSLNGGTSE